MTGISVNIMPDGRLRRRDAALYLGFSEKTLANYAYRGLGPRAVKVGGRVFYYVDDLDAFIQQGG
jgi:predicted DNA-binding transcriptional regulator AlpA